MISRNLFGIRTRRQIFRTGIGVSLVFSSLVLVGCKKKAPPPPPPRKNTNTGPVTPPWRVVVETMELSPKVDVKDAEYKGVTEEQMRATYQLMDALARGDSSGVRSLLDPSMVPVLDDLVSSGAWQKATSEITKFKLKSCTSDTAGEFKVDFTGVDKSGFEDDSVDYLWVGKNRGSSILFAGGYELESQVEIQQKEVKEEEGKTGSKRKVKSGGKGTPSDPGNPKDPRRRIPKQAPSPGGPG